MWFSIESRLPYLDHRIVEKTLACASSLKIYNGKTKAILRNGMKGILPEKIRLRNDKVGFATPLDEWLREPYWQSFIYELLNSESFKGRRIINQNKALKIYTDHLSHKNNSCKELWKMIHLELWFREFID